MIVLTGQLMRDWKSVFDKSAPLSVCCNEAASGQKAR